jgi:hypothetical protein
MRVLLVFALVVCLVASVPIAMIQNDRSQAPPMSLEEFRQNGFPASHRSSVEQFLLENPTHSPEGVGLEGINTNPSLASYSSDSDEANSMAMVEVSTEVSTKAQTRVKIVHQFCEICILIMQMKERGQPHLCQGLNAAYYTTCIENLESLLRADKAQVYWLKNGCMYLSATGPEIVRPCPAMNICSWTPNLFATPPNLVRDSTESICPKDPKFLPTIPQEYQESLK